MIPPLKDVAKTSNDVAFVINSLFLEAGLKKRRV